MKDQIPSQYTGGHLDTTSHVTFNNEFQAREFYNKAKHRLLDVSHWWEICEVPISTFTLTDQTGCQLNRLAAINDYIKINIPGPGTSSGDGFDWVKVEQIIEEERPDQSMLSLQARPCPNPTNDSNQIAHFFESSATSTFQIKLQGNTVFALEHGRNEVANVNTNNILDNVRNGLVGWSARLGLSFPQWKSLMKGVIKVP